MDRGDGTEGTHWKARSRESAWRWEMPELLLRGQSWKVMPFEYWTGRSDFIWQQTEHGRPKEKSQKLHACTLERGAMVSVGRERKNLRGKRHTFILDIFEFEKTLAHLSRNLRKTFRDAELDEGGLLWGRETEAGIMNILYRWHWKPWDAMAGAVYTEGIAEGQKQDTEELPERWRAEEELPGNPVCQKGKASFRWGQPAGGVSASHRWACYPHPEGYSWGGWDLGEWWASATIQEMGSRLCPCYYCYFNCLSFTDLLCLRVQS